MRRGSGIGKDWPGGSESIRMPRENSKYLFSDAGLTSLHSFIDAATLLAFDLDGTLAPIAADPGRIRVSRTVQEGLARLAQQATVAIITGRRRGNARQYLGVTPHFLIGNHGAEGLPGREAQEGKYSLLADNWEVQLRGLLAYADGAGIVIENKGATVAVHYRAAPDRRAARALVRSCVGSLSPPPRTISGKCVEDLVPISAPDKGEALLYLMNYLCSPKGFFIGDDKTDEDIFRLPGERLFTVRVGATGTSRAGYMLRSQREVSRLLKELVSVLTGPNRQ